MIEAHYGALLDTARVSLLERLDAGGAVQALLGHEPESRFAANPHAP